MASHRWNEETEWRDGRLVSVPEWPGQRGRWEESKCRGSWSLPRKGAGLLSVKTDGSQVGRHDGLVKYQAPDDKRERGSSY